METDIPQVHDNVKPLIMNNGLELPPVSIATRGEGLPYAPQNWPKDGDVWRWKTGSRIANSGYFNDRYLYPPQRLVVEHGAEKIYKSKLALAEFLNSQFPEEDADAFFSSFNWQIASHKLYNKTGNTNVEEQDTSLASTINTTNWKEVFISVGEVTGVYRNMGCCKARNETCNSFEGEGGSPSKLLACNICCTEQGFCRSCCCILCCQSIRLDSQRFEYFRCDAKTDGDYICGHIAHIECAIRASLAGTLEGNNGLDAEYYCLRCDSRTDLVSYVINFVLSRSETKNIRANAKKVLSVCVRMLDGSKKKTALQLLDHIRAIIERKHKGVTNLKEVWGKEDTSHVAMGVTLSDVKSAPISMIQEDHPNTKTESRTQLGAEFDHWIESSKLEDEVDEVLSNLKKSQNEEYKVVEDRLLAQACYIHKLSGGMKNADGESEDKITQEVLKFEGMKEVRNGFGRTSERNIKHYFHM